MKAYDLNFMKDTISPDIFFRFSKFWFLTVLWHFFHVILGVCRVFFIWRQATCHTLWLRNKIVWKYDLSDYIKKHFYSFFFSKFWFLTFYNLFGQFWAFFGYFLHMAKLQVTPHNPGPFFYENIIFEIISRNTFIRFRNFYFWTFHGIVSCIFLGVFWVFLSMNEVQVTVLTQEKMIFRTISRNIYIENDFWPYFLEGVTYENLGQETFAPWAVLRSSALSLHL